MGYDREAVPGKDRQLREEPLARHHGEEAEGADERPQEQEEETPTSSYCVRFEAPTWGKQHRVGNLEQQQRVCFHMQPALP